MIKNALISIYECQGRSQSVRTNELCQVCCVIDRKYTSHDLHVTKVLSGGVSIDNFFQAPSGPYSPDSSPTLLDSAENIDSCASTVGEEARRRR